MTLDNKDVAVIIPAFNEAKTISNIVKGVSRFGAVIVVDDGSSDNTASMVEQDNAYVVTHEKNKGYDEALYSGYKKALELEKKILISIDADGQHDTEDIIKIIEPIKSGRVKISIGVRPNSARISEKIYIKIAKKLYGIEDVLCGLKAFHSDVFSKYGYVVRYKTMATALLMKSVSNKYKFEQNFINLKDREDLPRIGSKFKANWIIFKGMLIAFYLMF